MDRSKNRQPCTCPHLLSCEPDEVEYWISQGEDPNGKDEDGNHPLNLTCNPKKIEALIKNGADMNAPGRFGHTPVMYALKCQVHEAVLMYAKYGTRFDLTDVFGRSAIHYACNVEDAKVVLDNGDDVNRQDNFKETPLIHASMIGSEELTELLLDYGANPNIFNINRSSALIFAETDRQTYALLKHGALVTMDNEGRSPLSEAESRNNLSQKRMILAAMEYQQVNTNSKQVSNKPNILLTLAKKNVFQK